MNASQCDVNTKEIKDLIVVCDNDTYWNSVYNMIEYI